MVKETINFNTSLGAADFLERTVERLEDENAELLCEVGARREREERVWALCQQWSELHGVRPQEDYAGLSELLRAVLEG